MRLYQKWSLCAVALLMDAQPLFRAEVNLVRVPCVVTDANGAPVATLGPEDFIVDEDGVSQSVKYLWKENDLPLTVGVIADVSGSEVPFVSQQQDALGRFFSGVLSLGDHAVLVSVAFQAKLEADLTGSVAALHAATRTLGRSDAAILGDPCAGIHKTSWSRYVPACGGTALWNGVFFTAKLKLKPQPGRKALLLLTDGWDTGSDHSVTDAIEACQAADTMVYSIRYADPRFSKQPRWGFHPVGHALAKGRRDLARLSEETGGVAFESGVNDLANVFARIQADLRSQNVLGYLASPTRGERSYHRIKVSVGRPGLSVRARAGYYVVPKGKNGR
jgi:VWFA-related protein